MILETALEQARAVINETDREMAKLFVRRMEAVQQIAQYKKERGLPVWDAKREEQVLLQNAAYAENEEIREYYTRFLMEVMRLSRCYQNRLNAGLTVAYAGTVGAFAHIAAKRLFPEGTAVAYSDFKSAYRGVIAGECDAAVLPVENSAAGEVGAVSDLLFAGPLHINRMLELGVSHRLLGIAGSKKEQIKTVVSHPQALAQCRDYLEKAGYQTKEFENTALAAEYVAKQNDPTLAAVAGEEAAEIFGLEVLEREIQSADINTTRFAVLSLTENQYPLGTHGISFALMFTVKNEAGALARALNIIGSHGYNLRTLRSRPMKELLWQYYFYAEAEGNINSTHGKSMLEQLQVCCDDIKVLGSFVTHATEEDAK